MALTTEHEERLQKLADKYNAMGQDMSAYLDGLLYADYLTFWDYIRVDTLLSLQSPRTPFADEHIFITYHQISELYFRLSIKALEQITTPEEPSLDIMKIQLERVVRYFDNMVYSFDIMTYGMDRDDFIKFRNALLPASGFQSAQYRILEFMSTDLFLLVNAEKREQLDAEAVLEEIYPHLYWKSGATELGSGKKTLTLRQFELHYDEDFLRLAHRMKTRNIRRRYYNLSPEERQDPELIDLLRQYDEFANVRWPLAHLIATGRYLRTMDEALKATGGTNWRKYLPPRFRKVTYFPELWSQEELDNWGVLYVQED